MVKAIIECLRNQGSVKEVIVVDIKEEVPKCFCEEIRRYFDKAEISETRRA